MTFIDKPYTAGKLHLNNRLVFPPMASGTPSDDNKVTEANISHYAARAKGGSLGLIIVEHSFISPDGMASAKQLSVASDGDVAGLTQLTQAIHFEDVKTVLQINHAGGATRKAITGKPSIGPAADAAYSKFNSDIKMTTADIERTVSQFAAAACRAKAAGFDGVEIHSAHGYLLNQFYSPLTNNRTDEYGGSLENRVRIHLEVIAAVRAAVGEDFPIFLRLGACDYMTGGSTIENGVAAAKLFEKSGVDFLDISGGLCMYTVKGRETEPGVFRDASCAIKKSVNIPVILTGGITDLNTADRLIAEEQADLIGIGRPLFKDANWANAAFSEKSRAR